MITFELQKFTDGQWKVDCMFDDKNLAVFEAKRLDDSKRYSGVRVIEEIYDEDTNLTTTRTVFRGHEAEKKRTTRIVEGGKKPKRTAPTGGTGKEPLRKGRTKPKAKSSNILVPVLILMVVVLGGLAALFGLQQLSLMG